MSNTITYKINGSIRTWEIGDYVKVIEPGRRIKASHVSCDKITSINFEERFVATRDGKLYDVDTGREHKDKTDNKARFIELDFAA